MLNFMRTLKAKNSFKTSFIILSYNMKWTVEDLREFFLGFSYCCICFWVLCRDDQSCNFTCSIILAPPMRGGGFDLLHSSIHILSFQLNYYVAV